ncbi:MAG TPA: helix-turn-helix transcriptional regulator [Candidatus Olsenella pullicola]|nr:helix-turn-helix transcriptional regulator [Candidatus Olsenella pullicola]
MPIVMRLDRIMAEKKISSTELATRIGTSTVNLSNIKNGHIRGVRFSTLEALCQVLNCKPGDLIDYVSPEDLAQERALGEITERSYPRRGEKNA